VTEMTHSLYCLTSPSGKKYYGISKRFEARMMEHMRSAKAGVDYVLSKAIRKYGWDSFRKEVVCTGVVSVIKQLEVSAIAVDNTLAPSGYNMTAGGDGGSIPAKMGGLKASALKLGVHAPGQVSNAGKKSRDMKVGVHAASKEQLSTWGKIGADPERSSAIGKIVSARKFKCVECGLVSNAGNLKQHQRAKKHTGISSLS
jgi:hypothetical protein